MREVAGQLCSEGAPGMRDSVTNIRKHSHAHRIMVTVEQRRERLADIVVDDETCFDVVAAPDPSPQHLHLAMRSRIERVRMAGGTAPRLVVW